MRSRAYTRFWLIVSWISLAVLLLVLDSHRAKAQQWKVVVPDTYFDSVLYAGVDTATTEGGWCAVGAVNHSMRTIVLLYVMAADSTRSDKHESHFACPPYDADPVEGTQLFIVHRHLADINPRAVHGPSDRDKEFIYRAHPQPGGGIIVYRKAPGEVELIPYAVR